MATKECSIDAKELKASLRELMSCSNDVALVDMMNLGSDVDVIVSRKNPDRAMTLREAERHLDVAIRAVWKAVTGQRIKSDPLAFIQDDAEGQHG